MLIPSRSQHAHKRRPWFVAEQSNVSNCGLYTQCTPNAMTAAKCL